MLKSSGWFVLHGFEADDDLVVPTEVAGTWTTEDGSLRLFFDRGGSRELDVGRLDGAVAQVERQGFWRHAIWRRST